jgi:hypothetical protein
LCLSLSLSLSLGLLCLTQTGKSVIAQTESPYLEPTNLSASGSASQPAVAAAPNGALHTLWWDTLDGMRYSRAISGLTQTTWSRSVIVPTMYGDRQEDLATKTKRLSPPTDLQMAVDRNGVVYAAWLGRGGVLSYSRQQGAGWSPPVKLTDGVAASTLTADISGTLRLAYVQRSANRGSPPGVYFAPIGSGPIRRTLVYSSTYFRSANPDDVTVGMSADGKGNIVLTWHPSRHEQSKFARSGDGGKTWSAPQDIVPLSPQFGLALKPTAVAIPGGDFVLLWQDASAPGCGLTQSRSNDGGQTWSPPERVLVGLSRCPDVWRFAYSANSANSASGNSDRGGLWFLGLPMSEAPAADTLGWIAAWNGEGWSQVASLQFSHTDPLTKRPRVLGCLNMALAGETLALIGCDARDDMWATRNRVTLNALLPTISVAWSAPAYLSRGYGSTSDALETTVDVDAAADSQGRIYAVWTRARVGDVEPTSLFVSVWTDRWQPPAEVLRASSASEVAGSAPVSRKIAQPRLTIDKSDRLHLVWSGGASGRPFYSEALSRDAAFSSGWAPPVPLPALSDSGSSPDIVVDPRGVDLYVAYAIPFNEKRGIYLVKSNDAGKTWGEPLQIVDAVAAGWRAVDAPRLAFDPPNDRLHAVWLKSTLPGTVGSQEVYYANSSDGGQTWSQPLRIAQGDVSAPRVVVWEPGKVSVVWNVASTVTRSGNEVWSQFSQDGGERWSAPERVPDLDNVDGPVAVVSSGDGQMYLTALGQGGGGQVAVMFSQWQGNKWGKVEVSNYGQPAEPGNTLALALRPDTGSLNAILRSFEPRPNGAGSFEVAAVSRDVTPAQLTPLPTFTPQPTVESPPTPTPQPTPTAQLVIDSTAAPRGAMDAATTMSNALLPSVLLAAGVIILGTAIALYLLRRR